MVVRTLMLLALPAMAGAGSIRGQASPHCRTGDPSGYFTGIVTSHQSGRLEASLNLRCTEGRYDGALLTPLGTFPITGGHAASGRLHLLLTVGADVATIDATAGTDTLGGRFAVPGDSGTVILRRIGEVRAADWDAPKLDLTAAQWRQDIAFFAHNIVARHGNAFHSLSRPHFDSLIATLDRRLDSLNGDQAYVELDRIANLIGDAHTYVVLPRDAPRFPFEVRRFGSEYRVVAVARGNERILGAQLLEVQDQPVSAVIERLWGLTPADEHSPLRQTRAEGFLSMGVILHGLGLTPDRNAVTLTLTDDAGRPFRFQAQGIPTDIADTLRWRDVFDSAPLYLQHPNRPFWCQQLPEARSIYCSFRGYDSLPTRASELLKLVARVHPEKLVIDLRQNGGGDYKLGLKYLVEPILRLAHLNQWGRPFIAIGPNTFSAGMANAAQFRTDTTAILVGQMIGEKPNSFQEPREMRLPNSHLIVRYSTRYYRFADQGPNAVYPHHEVAPTWAEYRAGRDPVLEWILQYTGRSALPHRRESSGD
jgi:hypothetical protein